MKFSNNVNREAGYDKRPRVAVQRGYPGSEVVQTDTTPSGLRARFINLVPRVATKRGNPGLCSVPASQYALSVAMKVEQRY